VRPDEPPRPSVTGVGRLGEALAIPKSHSLTSPSFEISTLGGDTSRWTSPRSRFRSPGWCGVSRAAATCAAQWSASGTGTVTPAAWQRRAHRAGRGPPRTPWRCRRSDRSCRGRRCRRCWVLELRRQLGLVDEHGDERRRLPAMSARIRLMATVFWSPRRRSCAARKTSAMPPLATRSSRMYWPKRVPAGGATGAASCGPPPGSSSGIARARSRRAAGAERRTGAAGAGPRGAAPRLGRARRAALAPRELDGRGRREGLGPAFLSDVTLGRGRLCGASRHSRRGRPEGRSASACSDPALGRLGRPPAGGAPGWEAAAGGAAFLPLVALDVGQDVAEQVVRGQRLPAAAPEGSRVSWGIAWVAAAPASRRTSRSTFSTSAAAP